ncbi:MFS transporter [Levilactobacillus acidifarinae]|uniref:MFS transporter n=1 Tax=Levilactobacillus acidifarinae TaxID=267364 RepID=UPI00070E4065|nr:MFS transporter [Levilactobacillus acidifarinae]GEO70002.1 MFS transporter [Levilactobacillus acidifarinae]
MTKYQLQAAAFVLVSFMLGCNEFIVVGIISDIASSLKVSVATVGYLVTVFAIVYAISTPLITVLTNRFNRYHTFMALMIIFLIGNTLTGFATSFPILVAARLITAVVAGTIESLCIAISSVIAPRNKRAILVSWLAAGFSIASVIGVPIGTAISTHLGWQDAFHVISLLSLVTCIVLGLLLPRNLKQPVSGIKDQLVLLTDKRIYLGAALILFTAATSYAYYTYVRPLITTTLGFNTSMLNWLLMIIGIVSIVSNRLSGTLAEHHGLKQLPKLYVVDIILLCLFPLAMLNAWSGYGLLLLLTLLVLIGGSPIQIHFLDVAEADYPQAIALASALNAIFFNVGISLGSATASGVLQTAGLTSLGWGAALFAVISLGLSVWLNRTNARQAQRQPAKFSE